MAYLNAAMPPDQWEDFDDGEVRSALSLDGGDLEDTGKGVGVGRPGVWVVKEGDGHGDRGGGEEVVRLRE